MVAVILAEKPSVAGDLARVLGASSKNDSHYEGNGLLITWAVGHLLELKSPEAYDKKYKTWKMDTLPIIPEQFKTKAKGSRNEAAQLRAIVSLFKRDDIDELVNACDAAREGELIFRRIQEHSKVKVKVSRMWMRSMTDSAIQSAWDDRKPDAEYEPLGDAARSRSEADWLIGMNGSRAATLRLRSRGQKGSISLGRVQTPTLAMLVDKELEVLSHVPSPFWELDAELSQNDAMWNAKWRRSSKQGEMPVSHIIEQSELDSLKAELAVGKLDVAMTQKERIERSPLNFDLTTLQKVANQLWNMSAKETGGHAQQLYERFKVTTYPRTESKYLPEDSVSEVKGVIGKLESQSAWAEHAKRLLKDGLQHEKRNFNDAKVSDHHAIIPTGKVPPSELEGRTRLVYDLIVGRFLASFHPNALWEDEKRKATLGAGELFADANILKTGGWRKVVPKSAKMPLGWGKIKPKGKANVDTYKVEEGVTKPKSRFKDAGILSRMENAGRDVEDDEFKDALKGKGLGTPATRAETIEKLITKGLAQRLKNGSLRATPDGIRLIDVVRHIPVEWITSPGLTGEMESRLSEVEKGDAKSSEYMGEIISKVGELVDRFSNFKKEDLFKNEDSVGNCKNCGSAIEELDQRYSCSSENCDVVYWKRSMGRYFDRPTMKRLLAEGSITELHGFVRRADSETYSTGISIGEKGEVNFQEKPAKELNSDNSEELCECAICNSGSIFADDENFGCDNPDCILLQGRKMMGRRKMSNEEVIILIKEGKTPVFSDFISKRGNPFSACLFLEKKSRSKREVLAVSFEFAQEDLPEYEVDSTPLLDDGKGKSVIETKTHFQVLQDGVKEYEIARTVKDRQISREECISLVEKNQVGPLEEFISAKGKPFTATLYLDGRKNIKFKFAPRKRKSKKK
jgi:DNA topoisomerase III